jgi:hypothetical protein
MVMHSLRCSLWRAVLSAAFLLALTAGARADLIVANPDFTMPNPSFSTTTLTGAHLGGPSAAADWGTFNNSSATTTTSLLPSTLTLGGSHTNMIHVVTSGAGNGLVQVLAPVNTGPDNATTSAYVYVNSGRVGLGTGNGGTTSLDALSGTTKSWELLQGSNGHSPANEIVLYSASGPADFYVGLVSIDPSTVQTASAPEPSALLSSTLGVLFSILGVCRWRRMVLA